MSHKFSVSFGSECDSDSYNRFFAGLESPMGAFIAVSYVDESRVTVDGYYQGWGYDEDDELCLYLMVKVEDGTFEDRTVRWDTIENIHYY